MIVLLFVGHYTSGAQSCERATVYDLKEFDGRTFLVMELVEGETLADRIARGPIPAREALSLFVRNAEGLSAAHEKGIVHRYLKPANIDPERSMGKTHKPFA